MGWDRDRYYTRSVRINARVVREYVGCGRVGELAAKVDAAKRAERRAEAEMIRRVQAKWRDLDDQLAALNQLADLMSRAALVSAGYHQHHRAEWRRRRVTQANK